MYLAVGCDHRGLAIKRTIIEFLQNSGYDCCDCGAYGTDPVDYPDIARKVGEMVSAGDCAYGVLICSTGIGMSIAANKIKGIRAASCCNAFAARRARKHNDANILCLGADNLQEDSVLEILQAYLSAEFAGGRHGRRVDKIREMESD